MEINITVNDKNMALHVKPDDMLVDTLRGLGLFSVKRGCETSSCGLCTVLVNGSPELSCSVLTATLDGCEIHTIEGLEERAAEFGAFLANEGGEQCGFCSPGFVVTVLAMERELDDPSEQEIKEYLVGNLCRCTGYQSQLRAIKKFLARDVEVQNEGC